MNHDAVGSGVLVGLLLLFAAASGGAVADVQETEDPEANETFGAEVSSFMQASTADAETEVDEGMFRAGMNRAETGEERRRLIEKRQARLAARHAQLQDYREEFSTDQPAAKNRAVAARVSVGADGLERSVESTQEHAVRAGLDTSQLSDLRNGATELRGQVADLARQLGGGGRSGNDRGDDRSSNGDGEPPGADRRNGNEDNGTDRTVDIFDGRYGDSEETPE